MAGKIVGLHLVNVYHQAFTAVTTGGAADIRRYFAVEFSYQLVYLRIVVAGKESPELVVFGLFFSRKRFKKTQVRMKFDRFQ